MTADVLKDSYLMATGYAALMGADAERQHLFARRYDYAVTPTELEQHWKAFESEPNLHRCADCGTALVTETCYQFVTPGSVAYVCRDHFLARDRARREKGTAAAPPPAQTLVRLFQDNERVANLLVDDWQDRDGEAQFTIPSEHDRARWLMETAIAPTVGVIVMTTEAIEWLIHSVTAPVRRDLAWPHPNWLRQYHLVRLVSRTRRLRESQPSDEYCREMFGTEIA